jgi:hypothetical protein
MFQSLAVVLASAGLAAAQLATTSEPPLSAIQAAQATTVPLSPKSNVKGVAFQHFYQVWLENTVSDQSNFYSLPTFKHLYTKRSFFTKKLLIGLQRCGW